MPRVSIELNDMVALADQIREITGTEDQMSIVDMTNELSNNAGGGGDIDAMIDGSIEGDITSNVTTVKDHVFRNCTNLTSVNFPSATSIGTYAFRECSNLTSANFPSATSVESQVLYKCINLTSANFPSATSIGNFAFWSDYYLVKLILGTKQTTVSTLANTGAFSNCFHILGTVHATYNPDGLKDGYIYVPLSLVADYRVATNWDTYATQIMPWVATVEELTNIDGTTYDHACVGEGVDSVEYAYNGTTWEIFR